MTPLRIFILEDDIVRIKYFKSKLSKHHTYFFNNVEKAKVFLLSNPVDVIMLDHDLDHRVYVKSEEANTGYQLAKFIKENSIFYSQCIIHSMNVVGANNMKSILEDAVLLPFGDILSGNLLDYKE